MLTLVIFCVNVKSKYTVCVLFSGTTGRAQCNSRAKKQSLIRELLSLRLLQPIWSQGQWLRRHLLLPLPPLQHLRLRHQVVLVVARREQVEQHLEALRVEVLEAPEALLVEVLEALLAEVLEARRELEVLQAQVGLPALELLPRVPLEQLLEQYLR